MTLLLVVTLSSVVTLIIERSPRSTFAITLNALMLGAQNTLAPSGVASSALRWKNQNIIGWN